MRKRYFPNIYILSHSRKKKCHQKQCSAHPKLWLFKALCKAPAECPKPCLPLLSTALPSQEGRPNLPVSTGEEPKPNCLNSQRLKLERFTLPGHGWEGRNLGDDSLPKAKTGSDPSPGGPLLAHAEWKGSSQYPETLTKGALGQANVPKILLFPS